MEKKMETTIILGLYRDNGKENGNYFIIAGYIGVIWGIMEKKMETTIMGYMGGCQNYDPFLDPYSHPAPEI